MWYNQIEYQRKAWYQEINNMMWLLAVNCWNPGLNKLEQITQIGKEQKQEIQLLTEVTEETFSLIERTLEQDGATVQSKCNWLRGTLIVSYG